MELCREKKGFQEAEKRRTLKPRGTYQSIAVVNGNRGSGDVGDVTDEGAVRLQQLPLENPLRCIGPVGARCGVPKPPNLVVPLHHRPGRHQPVVGPQSQVELLPEGRDVEEESLLGLGEKRVPPHALLVRGGQQVGQVVTVGVGAEGRHQAVLLQPALQLVWQNKHRTGSSKSGSRTSQQTATFCFNKKNW